MQGRKFESGMQDWESGLGVRDAKLKGLGFRVQGSGMQG